MRHMHAFLPGRRAESRDEFVGVWLMDKNYDVIIIGAGPAGTITAKLCAEKDLKVLVLEKRQEIGAPKRCAECLGHDDLVRLGYTGKERFVAQTIKSSYVFSPDGTPIEIRGPTPGYILERKVFDKFLAYDAAKAGAKIYTKAEVFDLIRSSGMISGVRAIYNGEQKDIHGKIIVSAEGIESKIARLAGLPTRNTRKTASSGYQYEMAGIDLKDPDKILIYVGNDVAPIGYVWIFPKGEHIANVGIGITRDNGKTAKYYLDRWIDSKPEIKKGSIIEENSGGIPIGGLLESMTRDNFLAIGDSAHQVHPLHGGGLTESSFAAAIAAKVITDAIKSNDTSNKALDAYNRQWWKERGVKLQTGEKILKILERFTDADFNLVVRSLKGEDLFDIFDGKPHKFVKILMKNPRLATLVKYIK